ncbi:hypothetical protein [Phaffia rhodozyma]|uniref:Uncharacterized protein n=1 Tax=Phaffia rhodozyma TaxID=264483 RepID=A0A0F7SWZ0_PHARH|nr:hypothetical protein [Phaffia rhodozyma]
MNGPDAGGPTAALSLTRPTSPSDLSSLISQDFTCSSASETSFATSSSIATSISSGSSCLDLKSVQKPVSTTDDITTAMVVASLPVSAKATVASLTHLGRSRHRSKSSVGSRRDNRRGRSQLGSGSVSGSAGQRSFDTDEIKKMSRDELVKCLECERDDRNKLKSQVEELTTSQDVLHASNERLQMVINAHVQSEEEHEQERVRVELQMASKIAHIQKSNYQIARLRREKRELEKKYTEEVKNFESERQALYDNEQLLKTRCQTLASRQPVSELPSARTVNPPDSPSDRYSVGENAQLEAIQEADVPNGDLTLALDDRLNIETKMKTLEAAYQNIRETLKKNEEEVVNLKQINAEYQQEIVAYEYLLMERTISGKMQDTQLLSQSYSEQPGLSSRTTASSQPAEVGSYSSSRSLYAVHEEDKLSTTGVALDPDFADRSLSFSEGQEAIDKGMLDPEFKVTVADKPDTKDETGQGYAKREKKGRVPMEQTLDSVLIELGVKIEGATQGEVLGNFAVTGSGMDLAAELGRAEAGQEEGKLRNLGKGDDGEALLSELRNLRDANKALTLYCSKILDRILSIDGFEDVLSADNGKSLQGSVRRLIGTAQQKKTKSRPSLQNTSFRAAGEPVATTVSSLLPIDTTFSKPALLSSKKKSRASVDWRSFTSFFSPSSPSSTMFSSPVDTPSDEKSSICNLSIALKPIETSDPPSGRKLSKEEEREEEEDRVQRQHTSLLQRQLQDAEAKSSIFVAPDVEEETIGLSSSSDATVPAGQPSQQITTNVQEAWDDSANSSDLSFKSCGEPGCLGVGNCESGHVCGGVDSSFDSSRGP